MLPILGVFKSLRFLIKKKKYRIIMLFTHKAYFREHIFYKNLVTHFWSAFHQTYCEYYLYIDTIIVYENVE